MPKYVYKCRCSEVEVIQPMDAPAPKPCKKCGGRFVRQFSVPRVYVPNPVSEARRNRGRGR